MKKQPNPDPPDKKFRPKPPPGPPKPYNKKTIYQTDSAGPDGGGYGLSESDKRSIKIQIELHNEWKKQKLNQKGRQ